MNGFDLAPILLFVYNRPQHTKLTVNALLQNEFANESALIIYSDGSKSEEDYKQVVDVRNYIKTISGFKSVQIVEQTKNYGLGNNIIDGVTSVVNEFGKVIVLEDDLLASPYFLKYMNEGLQKYASSTNVISIHSYIYPIKKKLPETFFIKGADCLGWATWKEKWKLFEADGAKLLSIIEEKGLTTEFDFNNSYPFTQMLREQISGINSSWAIRWYASAFIHDMLTLYPGRSLIYHHGNDGSGTNFGKSTALDVKMTNVPIAIKNVALVENLSVRKIIEGYFKNNNAGFIRIVYRKIKKVIL